MKTITAGKMIQRRAAELGAASASEVARRMRALGCEVSRQAVAAWFRGHSSPSGERLSVLLDVLALEGGARRDMAAAIALSGGRG